MTATEKLTPGGGDDLAAVGRDDLPAAVGPGSPDKHRGSSFAGSGLPVATIWSSRCSGEIPSRTVDGVISFDVARDLADPSAFIATEVFEDEAARDRQESLPQAKKVTSRQVVYDAERVILA
jgi:hypothetical protein